MPQLRATNTNYKYNTRAILTNSTLHRTHTFTDTKSPHSPRPWSSLPVPSRDTGHAYQHLVMGALLSTLARKLPSFAAGSVVGAVLLRLLSKLKFMRGSPIFKVWFALWLMGGLCAADAATFLVSLLPMISVDARERLASVFAKMSFMLALKMSPWIEVDTSEVRLPHLCRV